MDRIKTSGGACEECNDFFAKGCATSNRNDAHCAHLLGSMDNEGDCAYCLYYNAGPGGGLEGCDSCFEPSSNFNLTEYDRSLDCARQKMASDSTCVPLYKNLTTGKMAYNGPHFGVARDMRIVKSDMFDGVL